MSKALSIISKVFFFAVVMLPLAAFAQEAADPAALAAVTRLDIQKWIAVAAGFGMAIAAFGGALSQSRAATAALEGIARNPNAADKIFTPMLLALAFIESLVLFTLLIAFLLYSTINIG